MTNHQIFVFFEKQMRKTNKTNANENANAAQFALFLHVFFSFFPGTTSALMRTFTRQQYLLYAPRENAKECENNAKIK